jgi:hypothetical protein
VYTFTKHEAAAIERCLEWLARLVSLWVICETAQAITFRR